MNKVQMCKSAEKVCESVEFEKAQMCGWSTMCKVVEGQHKHCEIAKSTPGGAQTGMQSHQHGAGSLVAA